MVWVDFSFVVSFLVSWWVLVGSFFGGRVVVFFLHVPIGIFLCVSAPLLFCFSDYWGGFFLRRVVA